MDLAFLATIHSTPSRMASLSEVRIGAEMTDFFRRVTSNVADSILYVTQVSAFDWSFFFFFIFSASC